MRIHRVLTALCVSLIAAWVASPALAIISLANRVFVSARSGSDSNACNNILTPCQTLGGAVVQLNPDGEAIVLDSGGYGALTITQGVTIEAAPGITAFIHPSSGDAITINAGVATVNLRGLSLNSGGGSGINVTAVGILSVERCAITGFATGINVTSSATVAVVDSTLSDNSSNGINATNGAQLDVVGSRILDNVIGITENAASADVRVTISGSSFLGNGEGIDVSANGGHTGAADISHSTFSHNGTGIRASNNFGTAPVRLAFSTVTANSTGVQAVNSGTFFTQGNNLIRDNPTANISLLTSGTSTTIAGD